MTLPDTRLSLVVRLTDRRDEQAWTAFLKDYEPFLLNLFRRRGLQDADARDVAQQVLLSVAQRVCTWQPDGQPASFRRWLTTIARHAALRFLTRSGRQPATSVGTDVADIPSEALSEYQQEALSWAMEQIREEFRPSTWAAFWETSVQCRAVDDVCREQELTAGAVYMARSRVMARLREKVKEFDPE
jgi:RNA polymerase sigma-70 factor (ECF subfamily)